MVRQNTNVPIEAFGGGAGLDHVTQAAQGVLGAVGQFVQREKEKADDAITTEGVTSLVNKTTELQGELLKRRGKDAIGVTDEFLSEFDKHAKEVEKGFYNDTQRIIFKKQFASERNQFNGILNKHEWVESQKFADQVDASYLASSQNKVAANFSDMTLVPEEIGKQQAKYTETLKRQGMNDPVIINEELGKLASANHRSVIEQYLDHSMYPGGQAYFNAIKDQLTEKDREVLVPKLINAETQVVGISTWNKVGNMRMADGMPDESKMVQAVRADTSINLHQRDQVEAYVRAKAGQMRVDISQAQQANDNKFMGAAVTARKSGASLEDALKLAGKFRWNNSPYDQSVKEHAIGELYKKPTETDSTVYLDLYERIQSGGSSKEEINAAFLNGKLGYQQHDSLIKEWVKNVAEGNNPDMQRTRKRVEALADAQQYDKEQKELYLYQVFSSTAGKSPQEVWKYANDQIKGDPNTGIKSLGWFQQSQWKSDLQRKDADNQALGKLYEDVGRSEVSSIGLGIGPSWSMGDINQFAQRLGGYSKIKKGQPANTAIQSLAARQVPITPERVQAVLSKWPNGIIPKDAKISFSGGY